MILGFPTELLALIAAGALVTSLVEGAFERDTLSRFVAHIVAATLLLIVLFVRGTGDTVPKSTLLAFVTSKPALYFVGISAAIASILEAFLRRHVFYRFVAHFVALLVSVWFLD